MTNEDFRTVWGQWIAENLVFYSTLLKEFLRLSVNLDFRPLWARKMLNKVLATFDDRIIQLIKDYEQVVIDNSSGYNDSQNEFWTLKVKSMLADCYPPGQGDHGLVFHNPHPQLYATSQSFSYLVGRSVRLPKNANTDSNGPCFKLATTLMNNMLEFQAHTKEPKTSFSAGLLTSIFGEFSPVKPATWGIMTNAGQDYDKSIKHLVRLFKVKRPAPVSQNTSSGYGLNYCEVDQEGRLTERGRQQLISGERIIDPQNLKNLKQDIWERPPMEFEIEFLLCMMRQLEFFLLGKLGAKDEQTQKSHFLYGFGRRFASTSAIFWYCVILFCLYYWFRLLFVFVVIACLSGGLFACLNSMDFLKEKMS